MTFSERCVKKPVTTLLVFIVLILLGIYCTLNLPVDMYPDMELPYMIVYTNYSNAGPEEVEQSLTRTLESSLSGLSGLKSLQSRSMSGVSMIILELEFGTNLDSAANEIRDKIDLVRAYLPADADTPITIKMDPSMMPIMMLTVQGQRTPEELRSFAEDVLQPKLEQLDGVASANVVGGRQKSINVEIPRDRLEAYGLSITTIAQMIGAQNVQSSGGTISSDTKNYTIKTNGKYQSLEDLKNTVISYKVKASDGLSRPEVVTLRLRDVADVYEGFKSQSTLAFLDGQSCVMLTVSKQSGKNSVTAAKNVRKALDKLKAEMPNDVQIIETYNTTDIIEQTINEVVNSVIVGALLAVIVLFIFLRSFKSTFIIGLAIPISVFITLLLMYFKGITINMISMAGLLLGIGMLVDNSIVVLENIYSYRQKDAKPTVAAVLGSQEMISSITSSTLTSVCIFLPMILFNKKLGMIGLLFDSLAYTIIFSLLCSLVVAVALVPVLCSSYLKLDKLEEDNKPGFIHDLNRGVDNFFVKLSEVYGKGVEKVLHHKKKALGIIIFLLIFSFVCIKWIGFIFMPGSASSSVAVNFELPKGTTIEVTQNTIQDFERKAMRVLKGVQYTSVTVGGTSIISSGASTNEGSITFTLYPSKERKKGWDSDVTGKQKLREFFNDYPDAKLSFSAGMNGISSGETSIEVKCDDLDLLRSTAKQIEDLLREKGQDVVSEVTSDQEDGLPQAEIIVDRNKMYEFGLNIYGVGAEINAAINGKTASRFTQNGEDIDVVVQLAEKDKKKLNDLDQISVVNNSGNRIPLSSFARYVENEAPVTIYRKNQSRIINVTAKPLEGLSLDVVQSKITKLINDNIPKDDAITISFSGDYTQMIEAVVNFAAILLMAAVLVFVVMASQFESLVDPFIVILTIPFSFIGVIAIYGITGQRLNVVTIMGVLILVGTIVNNGIVLVDYTNLLRKRGYSLDAACVEAAKSRLRPILMSTLTTVISLTPMAFFPGEGSASMQPISLTVFGGMTFGSIMTLFLMPSIYHFINSRRFAKAAKKAAAIEAKNQKKLEKLRAAAQEEN